MKNETCFRIAPGCPAWQGLCISSFSLRREARPTSPSKCSSSRGGRIRRWQLQDTNKLQTLKAKLQDLPVAFATGTSRMVRLGFGGFRIRGGETLGLPGEIRVYQGVIKTGQGKDAKYLKDSMGLEQSLISEPKQQAL